MRELNFLKEPSQGFYSAHKKHVSNIESSDSYASKGANHYLIRHFKAFLSGILLVLIPAAANAEDFYIAQTAAGLKNGTSISNAFSVAFFNANTNWSSPVKTEGKIGPGDVVHLVGAVTTPLCFQAGGTPKVADGTGPITLFFEPGAIMTSPAWPNPNNATGAITVPNILGAGLGYIVIDGGTNGVIQNTANGTEMANKTNSLGIAMIESHDSVVQNLTIKDLYVRIGPSGDQTHCGIGVKIFYNGGRNPAKNDLVTHCTFHDESEGVTFIYGNGWSAMELSFSTAYNCNWCGNAADAHSGATLSGLSVHDNDFYDFTNWDDNSAANSNHHNAFYGWAVSGGTLRNASYYNNVIGPNFGVRSTSGIYNSGDIGGILIYNNLFLESGPSDKPTNGLVYLLPNIGSTGTGYRVYNNTFIGGGEGIAINFSGGYGSTSTTFEAKNNIAAGVATFIAVYYNGQSTLVSDYNLFSGLNTSQTVTTSTTSSSHFYSFSGWQGLGYDEHSSTRAANLSANGAPESPSGAISTGTNLSSYFTTDINGAARPLGTGWDMGAYQPEQIEELVAPPVITNRITGLYRNKDLFFSCGITATNNPSSYSETGLPPGLSIDAVTGVISGTATSDGQWTIQINATNAGGTGSEIFTLYITPEALPVITSPLVEEANQKTSFSYAIAATNWPSSFTATGLPPGMSLSTWGVISGTPSVSGIYTVAISATNAGGTDTAFLIVTIL